MTAQRRSTASAFRWRPRPSSNPRSPNALAAAAGDVELQAGGVFDERAFVVAGQIDGEVGLEEGRRGEGREGEEAWGDSAAVEDVDGEGAGGESAQAGKKAIRDVWFSWSQGMIYGVIWGGITADGTTGPPLPQEKQHRFKPPPASTRCWVGNTKGFCFAHVEYFQNRGG
ncbi:MAG TPA: hypothetical protein VGM54_24135 [Chthoniobacter sp.]